MVIVKCTVPACEFQTDDVTEALAIALLANHGIAHQHTTHERVSVPATRGPNLERPRINTGVSTEEWNVFTRRWELFRSGSAIDDTSALAQLFQCAGDELSDSVLKADPQAASYTLPQLMDTMRSLAVIPVAKGVSRTELFQLCQEHDEPFRTFAARVRGKAETCAFTTKCECTRTVNYTDHMIRDVLIHGIADSDIRHEVLGISDILDTAVNKVIALVESKEMARTSALPSANLSSVSSFKRQSCPIATQLPQTSTKQATCPECKSLYHIFTQGPRGWNKKPHKVCLNCYRVRRQKDHERQEKIAPTPAIQSLETHQVQQIGAVTMNIRAPQGQCGATSRAPNTVSKQSSCIIGHQVFTKGEWKRARLRDYPRVKVTISVDINGQAKYSRCTSTSHTKAEVSAIADTGAQSDLWSLSHFLACGFSRDDLLPVNVGLSAANRSPISIEGAFFARITIRLPCGVDESCRSLVYVSSSVEAMYLSYDSLLNLGILSAIYPSHVPSEACKVSGKPEKVSTARPINDGCIMSNTREDATCSCPQRESTPLRPPALPFPCTAANNERMKKWLLDRYASSTINTCPHRALPSMEGPPVEIHVDPSAPPKACHTPSPVPLHWQQRVYEDLSVMKPLASLNVFHMVNPLHGAIAWQSLASMMVLPVIQLICNHSSNSANEKHLQWNRHSTLHIAFQKICGRP